MKEGEKSARAKPSDTCEANEAEISSTQKYVVDEDLSKLEPPAAWERRARTRNLHRGSESVGNCRESTCRIQYILRIHRWREGDFAMGWNRFRTLAVVAVCRAHGHFPAAAARVPAGCTAAVGAAFPFPSILAFPASPQQDTEYQSAKLRSLPPPLIPRHVHAR